MPVSSSRPPDEQFSEAETARRRDATIKNMIAMPPTPRGAIKSKKKPSRAKTVNRKSKKSTL